MFFCSPHLINKKNIVFPVYRPDIDGLRAIAVLAVIFFHAYPRWVKGGFIGVDIFFVISGFLISSIIFASLEKNIFSFAVFYSRRIRRIYPALIVVLTACFCFAWFLLFPEELQQLGKHIAAGAGFISNLVLWSESGYFNNAANTKPLLHLWSLGIEEQFYIVWPLLLWWIWKKRFNPLMVMMGLAGVSFVFNLYFCVNDAVVDFFSPLTRFWELLAGAMLAYVHMFHSLEWRAWKVRLIKPVSGFFKANPKKGADELVSILGVLFIFTGIVITKEQFFPGLWVLLPVIGTILLIDAGSNAWFNRRVLSRRFLVGIGLISYPLYLWHWPLFSFARILRGKAPNYLMHVLLIGMTFLLAWLTYRFVEKYLRYGIRQHLKTILLFTVMAVIGFTGFITYLNKGFEERRVATINVNTVSNIIGLGRSHEGFSYIQKGCGLKNSADEKGFNNCVHDSREKPRFALIGDSKAESLHEGLMKTSKEGGRWLFIGGPGKNDLKPVPVISDAEMYKNFSAKASLALNTINQNSHIKTVAFVMATRSLFNIEADGSISNLPNNQNYSIALDGVSRAIDLVTGAGKKVLLVVDNPTLPDPRDCVQRKNNFFFGIRNEGKDHQKKECNLSLDRHLELTAQYRRLLFELKQRYPGHVDVFDTTPILCDSINNACIPFKNGYLLYSYGDHISYYAATLIGSEINQLLAKNKSDIKRE